MGRRRRNRSDFGVRADDGLLAKLRSDFEPWLRRRMAETGDFNADHLRTALRAFELFDSGGGALVYARAAAVVDGTTRAEQIKNEIQRLTHELNEYFADPAQAQLVNSAAGRRHCFMVAERSGPDLKYHLRVDSKKRQSRHHFADNSRNVQDEAACLTTEAIRSRAGEQYDEILRMRRVVSAPGSFFLSGVVSAISGGFGIAQKLPLRVYVGYTPDRTLPGPELSSHESYWPAKGCFKADARFRATTDAELDPTTALRALVSSLRHDGNPIRLPGRIRVLSEIPAEAGMGLSGAFAAALATLIALENRVIDTASLQAWVRAEPAELRKDTAFEWILRTAWKIEAWFHGGVASATAPLAALVHSSSPIVFTSEPSPFDPFIEQNNIDSIRYHWFLLSEIEGERKQHTFDWALVYVGDHRRSRETVSTFKSVHAAHRELKLWMDRTIRPEPIQLEQGGWGPNLLGALQSSLEHVATLSAFALRSLVDARSLAGAAGRLENFFEEVHQQEQTIEPLLQTYGGHPSGVELGGLKDRFVGLRSFRRLGGALLLMAPNLRETDLAEIVKGLDRARANRTGHTRQAEVAPSRVYGYSHWRPEAGGVRGEGIEVAAHD